MQRRYARARPVTVGAACAVLLAAAFILDEASGRYPDLTVLYLVPITVAVYAYGLRVGIWVSVGALVLLAAAHPVAHWSVLAADVATHFAVFLFAAVLVDRLRRQLELITDLERERAFDLSVARDVQQGMLGDTGLRDERFEHAETVRFAREVGGDFYHLGRLGNDVFLCVGDISGKGVSAALFAAVVRDALVEGLARRAPLLDIARQVNERVRASVPSHMFVTMFLAVLSEDGLTYLDAGHVPPLLFRAAEGDVVELEEARTLPLGIADDIETALAGAPFTPGDTLLVVTDGVTESTRAMADPSIVAAALRRTAPLGVQAVVDDIVRVAEEGNERVDDVTVVAVRRLTDA